MPAVISFISSKGGAGKTTSALILATELASHGARVALLDADPNQPLAHWAALKPLPERLSVIPGVTEASIINEIAAAKASNAFVLVDVEGSANLTAAYAAGKADLIIIPSQGSQLDVREASKSISLIKQQEAFLERRLDYRVLLTRTNSHVRGGTLRHIESEISSKNIPCLNTEIHEREAYKTIFSAGGTLRDLTPSDVSGLKPALADANTLAEEIIGILKTRLAT